MRYLLALMILSAACGGRGPDVTFAAEPGPPTAGAARVQAALGEVDDLEFLGTVTGGTGEVVLVTFGGEAGDRCAALFEDDGFTTACGSLDPPAESVIVMQVGDGEATGLVVVTEPSVTEVRVATGTGSTYVAPRLGTLSYIAFEDDRSGYTLSLLVGDEVVHVE